MPWSCVRGARGWFGMLGPVPGVVCSPFPPSRPAFPALCVAGRPVRVLLILARWYAISCGLCVPRAGSGCPSGIPRVPFVCLCARALAASAPPSPLVGVVRAPRAVPVLGAGRAVPRGPCPFACPASVPCSVWLAWGGGRPGPVSPLPGLGLCAPRGVGLRVWGVPAPGGWGGVGGGGGLRAVLSDGAAKGASGAGGRLASVRFSAFPGQATKRVSLASLWPWRALAVPGRGQSVWRPGVLARVCLSIAVPAGAGGWVRGGGPCCGPPPGRCGPAGGRGDRRLCVGGRGGPAPPWPANRWGGMGGQGGGGSRRRSLPPSSEGRRPVAPCPVPPSPPAHPPQVCAFGRGRGAAPPPAAGGSAWQGGGGGVACEPPCPEEWPGGLAGRVVALPRSAPLPSLGGQQSGRHWRRSGPGGRGPHTAPVCSRVPAPGVVRVSSLCAGAVSSACRSPCGSRQWGAWQRAACGLTCVPPGRRSPFGGRGDVPLPRGGWRAGIPVARRPEGGVGERGEGGRAVVP